MKINGLCCRINFFLSKCGLAALVPMALLLGRIPSTSDLHILGQKNMKYTSSTLVHSSGLPQDNVFLTTYNMQLTNNKKQ